MNVTFFKSAKESGNAFIRPLGYAIDRIRSGRSKDIVEELRSADKQRRTYIKENLLAGVCFNGEFRHRSVSGIINHSGLCILDIDHIEDRQEWQLWRDNLTANSHSVAVWTSPSGDGLKCLFRIPADAENHGAYFDAIKNYLNCPYFDASSRDVSRLCFESYDPEIYFNPDAEVFDQMSQPTIEAISTTSPVIPVTSDHTIIQRLLTWFNRNYSLSEGGRNNNLFVLSCSMNRFGISQQNCLSVITSFNCGLSDRELASIVRKAYSRVAEHRTAFFEDRERYDIIQRSVIAGNTIEEIQQQHQDLNAETIQEAVKQIKDKPDDSIYWEYRGQKKTIGLIPHKFKRWLESEGYRKYYPSGNKTFTFVRIQRNLIEDTTEKQIKDHVLQDLQTREGIDYRPFDFMAASTKYFTSDFLSFIDTAEVKVLDDTQTVCYLYYLNCAVEITSSGYRPVDYIDMDGYIWKNQIIQRNFNPCDHHDCVYRKFIWLISGQSVERYDSLKSVIGYLLHSFKTSANNKAIIFNDETISDNPNGGSGKGLFWNAISHVKRVSMIDGKTFEFTKSFPYQTVATDTQVLVFDDVKRNFSFESLFSLITEGITIEYKGQDAIKLPVQRSPKIIITTNYTVGGVGGSFERRKFEVELSAHFSSEHTPLDEFGHLLFDEWNDDEWARFDNYMIQCAIMYLIHGLITHQYKNLHERKLIKETSFEFYEWAKEVDISGYHVNLPVNARIDKREYFGKFTNDYTDYAKKLTQKRFSQWLESWGKFNNYKIIQGKSGEVRWIHYEAPELPIPDPDKLPF